MSVAKLIEHTISDDLELFRNELSKLENTLAKPNKTTGLASLINTRTQFGITLLTTIAFHNRLDILDCLLFKISDLDVNYPEINSDTPLIVASKRGNVEIVKKLMKCPNLEINTTNGAGDTALMIASEIGELQVVQELMKSPNLEINKLNNNGYPAIVLASEKNKVHIVQELLKYPNIDINLLLPRNANNTILIYLSYEDRYLPCLKEVLKHPNINVNIVNNSGMSALIRACGNNCSEIIKELIKHPNINVNLQGAHQNTALMTACFHDELNNVKELLECQGIDPYLTNTLGRTAYLQACYNGNTRIIQFLIKYCIMQSGDTGVSRLINAVDTSGQNALFRVANNGSCINTHFFQEILRYKTIDPNHQDTEGNRPIFVAYHNNNKFCNYLLTDPRVNIMLKNADNKTIFDVAVEGENRTIIEKIARSPQFPINTVYKDPTTQLIAKDILFKIIVEKISNSFMALIKGHLVRHKWKRVLLNIANLYPNEILYQPIVNSKIKAELLIITSSRGGGSTFRRLQRENKCKFNYKKPNETKVLASVSEAKTSLTCTPISNQNVSIAKHKDLDNSPKISLSDTAKLSEFIKTLDIKIKRIDGAVEFCTNSKDISELVN